MNRLAGLILCLFLMGSACLAQEAEVTSTLEMSDIVNREYRVDLTSRERMDVIAEVHHQHESSEHDHESPAEHAGHDHSGSNSETSSPLGLLMNREFFAQPWNDSESPNKIWRSNLWLTLILIVIALFGWLSERRPKTENLP